VKSKSPRSGDEGQARRRTPNSSLPKATVARVSNGDVGVGSNVSTSLDDALCFNILSMDIWNQLPGQSSRILHDLFRFYQKPVKNESHSSSKDAALLDDSK
jgi:hypothetical protein